MRMADCHPDRKHEGKGLCNTCYMKQWRKDNPEQVKLNNQRSSERNREKMRDKARLFRENNPEEYRARNRRNYYKFKEKRLAYLYEWRERRKVQVLSRRYRAPEREVLRVLASERCEVCGSKEELHIDHDHSTGILRGRLCRSCNTAVGYLHDSADTALGIARYLLKYQTKPVESYPEHVDRRTIEGRKLRI